MKYKIYYSRISEKYLDRLTPTKSRRILTKLEELAGNPFKTDNNTVKLTGTKSSYRLRNGDIRIIYYLDEENKAIYITKIAPRGSAYSS